MTDREDLVLDYIKRFQAQLTRFERGLDAMAADIREINRHMAEFMTAKLNQEAEAHRAEA